VIRLADGTPTILTYSDINDGKSVNKLKSNELGLSDNMVEEECRVLLESKGCRLPKNVEFLEKRIVFRYVMLMKGSGKSDELQRDKLQLR